VGALRSFGAWGPNLAKRCVSPSLGTPYGWAKIGRCSWSEASCSLHRSNSRLCARWERSRSRIDWSGWRWRRVFCARGLLADCYFPRGDTRGQVFGVTSRLARARVVDAKTARRRSRLVRVFGAQKHACTIQIYTPSSSRIFGRSTALQKRLAHFPGCCCGDRVAGAEALPIPRHWGICYAAAAA
jgi:hypothetical protein